MYSRGYVDYRTYCPTGGTSGLIGYKRIEARKQGMVRGYRSPLLSLEH